MSATVSAEARRRGWRRSGVLALAAAAAGGLGSGLVTPADPAAAHEEVPGVAAVLDSVEPALPGVSVRVVTSASDQLVVAVRDEGPDVEVLGATGRPYARVSARGVDADLGDPAWYAAGQPYGAGVAPSGVTEASPERFVRVSTSPSWGFFDHRLHPAPLIQTPHAAPGATVRLESWQLQLRRGAVLATVTGHREYRRAAGTYRTEVVRAPAGLTALVLPGRPALVSVGIDTTTPGAGIHEVEIVAAGGEPLATLRPGRTEVNLASATWATTVAARTAGARAGTGVEAGVEVGVASGPGLDVRFAEYPDTPGALAWLDERAGTPTIEPPPDRLAGSSRVVTALWTIRLVVDGRPATIDGRTIWVPEAAGLAEAAGRHVRLIDRTDRPATRTWPIGAAGTGALLVGAGAWLARSRARRRRRQPDAAHSVSTHSRGR